MQCFGSVLVRLTEPLGSAEPPNLTEPLSSAEPEPVPERFGLPLIFWKDPKSCYKYECATL